MNSKKIILIIIVLLSSVFGCKDNPTTSEEKSYTPGQRNYSWKIIPLNDNAPFNHYIKIWALNPNDVWITGVVGDLDKTVIRYDGNQTRYFGRGVNPGALFGTHSDQIWLGGADFDVWKPSGSSFYRYARLPLEGYIHSYFGNIWGDSPNNIFAVGNVATQNAESLDGFIMKYDGQKWSYVNKPTKNISFQKLEKLQRTTNII